MDIATILIAQRELQQEMRYPMGLGEAAIKENVLAAIVEWTEVLSEINWKPWKKERQEVNRKALAQELCDVLQFWANVVNAAGLDEADITHALQTKWAINKERIKNGY